MVLLRDHGTWQLGDILEFAIGYAQGGYPVLPRIAETVAMVEGLFREHWPSSAAVYLRDGGPVAGARFRNPDLAATYMRLLAEAQTKEGGRETQIEAAMRAFYSGFVADAIERHCRNEFMDSSGVPHRGLLVGADLAGFNARHEEPITADFHGWTVAKCGPWSQGMVFLQQLRLLEGLDLHGQASCRLTTSTWSPSARSSHSRTAKPGTRTPTSRTCPSPTCLLGATPTAAADW
jgi:gamma-glutamyltranspeptidase/glutathione hydrolase